MPACADLNHAALLPLRRHSDYWLDAAWTPALGAVRASSSGPAALSAVGTPPVNGWSTMSGGPRAEHADNGLGRCTG
jgi:hypothetical protein